MALYFLVLTMNQLVFWEEKVTVKKKSYTLFCREVAEKYGVEGIGLAELLGLLLDCSNEETITILSQRGIEYMLKASDSELLEYKGITQRTLLKIQGLRSFIRRASRERAANNPKITSPGDVADLVVDMRYLDREHFRVIYINTKNIVLEAKDMFIGTLSSSIVHPREIFKRAVEKSAASIILVHNHPSNNPEPSGEDIKITKRIVEAGELMGIKVLDHIIIGGDTYKSLKELGYILN